MWVTVAAESKDGSTQYDTSTAVVNELKAGQTATTEATFTDVPSDAKFAVVDLM